MEILAASFPIEKNPLGLIRTITGTDAIKGDLLQLLLTNPNERVMLPTFGTPLRNLLFEQNDAVLAGRARETIANAIRDWEPRIVVKNIFVNNTGFPEQRDDPKNYENILSITIEFSLPDQIESVDRLVIQLPLGNA